MLDRAAKLKPANPILLQKLGEGYLLLGELTRAEEVYSQLLKDYPEIQALRAKLAEIYVRNGQKEKAAEQLEAIARDDPTNPQTHFYIGRWLWNRNSRKKRSSPLRPPSCSTWIWSRPTMNSWPPS
jgi:predicted Zn-dependent protease